MTLRARTQTRLAVGSPPTTTMMLTMGRTVGCVRAADTGGAAAVLREAIALAGRLLLPPPPSHQRPAATSSAGALRWLRLRPASTRSPTGRPTTGNGIRTGVDPTSPKLGKTSVVWSRRLDGAVYASPLIVGSTVIAATENDTVYALRAGHTVWSRHLGTPVDLASLPCGNIDPLGITGTPVYDGSSGILYVAAELAGPLRHTLYAINVVTGKVLWHRGLDLPGMVRPVEQQRGALALANGTVYVPLGGLYG